MGSLAKNIVERVDFVQRVQHIKLVIGAIVDKLTFILGDGGIS